MPAGPWQRPDGVLVHAYGRTGVDGTFNGDGMEPLMNVRDDHGWRWGSNVVETWLECLELVLGFGHEFPWGIAETNTFWARECPGLIPAEVSAIVHWAVVNPRRANELVDNIVSWRDVAMHRYAAPNPAEPVGSHARLHFDRVSEFYLEYPWLGEGVRLSFAEELALCKLLTWCRLLVEQPLSHAVFCPSYDPGSAN